AGSEFPDLVLGSYSVRSTLRAPVPTKVKAVRKGSGLKVSWAKAELVTAIGIQVVAKDGTESYLRVGQGKTSATVPKVAKEFGGTVHVTALGAGGVWSKAAKAPYVATKRPASVIVPFRKGGGK
ncbi:MAG: hypothetical protein Q7T55_04405, partial [Solirubrobacteraceae bacterium]|nr:hypothetical protein [Solirubrobacteraceae bacterium]